MRTLTTVAASAALAWLPPAAPAAAQDAAVTAALEHLELKRLEDKYEKPWKTGWHSPHDPAVDILRQVSGRGWRAKPDPRPAAELDAFADRLAAMVLDATLPEHVRYNAKSALRSAADPEARSHTRPRGEWVKDTPYPRAFDLLVQVYEGGYDDALFTIWLADSVRGRAYVQDVLDRSERPPVCPASPSPQCVDGRWTFRETTWCEAGRILYRDAVNEVTGGLLDLSSHGRRKVPEGLPEHVEDWYRRCRL